MTGSVAAATLAAVLVGVSTLASRRWGHGVGGVLSAFPLIVGPVLLIAAERHGAAFAAQAAAATLLGLVALAGFVVVYAWSAVRLGWATCLLLAWAAAAALGLAAGQVRPGLVVAGIGAALAIAVARGGLPETGTAALHRVSPAWDLPVRMLLTALLIVVLTAAADRFGPVVAGALSALPALASVLAVFTHRRDGTGALLILLRGTTEGMVSFAAFCAVAGGLLTRTGLAAAFLFALAAAVLVQAVVLRSGAGRSVAERGAALPVP